MIFQFIYHHVRFMELRLDVAPFFDWSRLIALNWNYPAWLIQDELLNPVIGIHTNNYSQLFRSQVFVYYSVDLDSQLFGLLCINFLFRA